MVRKIDLALALLLTDTIDSDRYCAAVSERIFRYVSNA